MLKCSTSTNASKVPELHVGNIQYRPSPRKVATDGGHERKLNENKAKQKQQTMNPK